MPPALGCSAGLKHCVGLCPCPTPSPTCRSDRQLGRYVQAATTATESLSTPPQSRACHRGLVGKGRCGSSVRRCEHQRQSQVGRGFVVAFSNQIAPATVASLFSPVLPSWNPCVGESIRFYSHAEYLKVTFRAVHRATQGYSTTSCSQGYSTASCSEGYSTVAPRATALSYAPRATALSHAPSLG